MRSTIPRPFLLALTLVFVVGAILLIELRLDAANPGDAQANLQSTGHKNGSNTAKQTKEPAMKGQRDQKNDTSGGGDDQEMSGQAESPSRARDETREMAGGIERKEAEFQRAEEIVDPTGFINTDDVSLRKARGEKVVLLDFWTYSCYNCQNTQPYINRWQEKYADDGLLIVGVHTPEFGFEKEYANVEQAVREAGIEYPVVLDNSYATWNAYDQRYWPAWYLIDADGFIRYKHFGEGAYEETDAKIRELLAEKDRISN